LYDYLYYFEEAYLLYPIEIYDLSLRKRQINPKKIYTIDPGIITVYSKNTLFDLGPAFENAVFLQLRRQYSEIFYYKTQSNKEVDFIILLPTGSVKLYQACIDLSSEKTRKREIDALIEASQELNSTDLYLITQDTEEDIHLNSLHIKVIPFWKWAAIEEGREGVYQDK
jgi:predicted AAA+ superfamily ATPase